MLFLLGMITILLLLVLAAVGAVRQQQAVILSQQRAIVTALVSTQTSLGAVASALTTHGAMHLTIANQIGTLATAVERQSRGTMH